ncbi:MAG: 50S ribosomal protein L23 [Fidelibacterota bacterium]
MARDRRIILRPILTEKMSQLEERERKYAFQVDVKANKIEIKKAIEKKFDVKVAKVSTLRMKGKKRQMTMRSGGHVIRTSGRRASWKKAMATLEEGFKIDLYGMEAES